MRRGLALCLGSLAVAAGCDAFGTDVTPAATGDGGVALDGAAPDEGGSVATREAGAPPACLAQIQDTFARNAVLAPPWRELVAPDPTRVKIIGEALEIETTADAGPEKYMLTTGAFAAPTKVACSFALTRLSDLNTVDNAPIDLFVLVLTAESGAVTQLHFGYYDGKLVVRDELGLDSKPVTIPKGAPLTLQLVVDDHSANVAFGSDLVTRPSALAGAATAEILFGVWSSSPYGQQVDLDNLQCSLACP